MDHTGHIRNPRLWQLHFRKHEWSFWSLALGALLALALMAFGLDTHGQISISHLSTYATGSYNTSAAEVVAFDPVSDRIFFVNAQLNEVRALNVSNPAAPTLAFTIPMGAYGAGANSVAVVPGGIAVAVEANPKTDPGKVVFFDANGTFLSQLTIGALPDHVTVTPNGLKVLVANEGEPNTAYTIDPFGTVSIIDISGGLATLTAANVTSLDFSAYTPAMLPGVRIFGPGASVAQDMEPEYIAVSDDSQKAFVTCQENNAVVRIDLATNTIEQITSLGLKDHSLPGKGLDASDSPTGINIANWPVKGMYMPDAADAFTIGGQTYVAYANEGDAREYTPLNEPRRIGNAAYVLDPAVFPNAATLKLNANLGRLNASISSGNLDADPEFEEIHVFGSRSFTIRDANGAIVWDSGDQLEQITSAQLAANFNCNNSANGTFDSRSDDKGPEPEAVAVATLFGSTYAFIGLERIGGIMVYDVSVPTAPVFVQYLNNRNFAGNAAAGTALDLGPEDIKFVSAADSPDGQPFLITGNEVSGTVSLFRICEETLWYADADGDGFGDANTDSLACAQPVGYVNDDTDDCPVLFGRVGDSCDDNDDQTVLDAISGSCTCVGLACTTDLTLSVRTDANASETTWELRQQGTNVLVQSGGTLPNNASLDISTCLPDGCYYLRVLDGGGDGIAGGGYALRLANGKRIIDNSSNFSNGSVSAIANDEGFCLPLGVDRVVSAQCDKYDWRNNEYIAANENPAVTAQYGVSNATSGYEIWFFDPNGGYTFKRFQNHNTANGLPASATRAAHFKVNGWNGNQLQNNVLYNVKVRSRVSGVNTSWGPVCRFILDPLRAQCPLTKLMDIPGNPYLSCNGTRNVGAGNLVHARPVTRLNNNNVPVNANRYQFRFRIQAENITVIKISATGQYWVPVTAPLQACKTYQVDVRTSFDNGATWCTDFIAPALVDPWGEVCYLNTSGCLEGTGGGQRVLHDGSTAVPAQLRMYPNPNRGDQLMIALDGIAAEVNTVSVDIHDTFGKRVSARTIAVADGFINTSIDLNGDLAAGMYMVNVTAGDDTYNERLVIQP